MNQINADFLIVGGGVIGLTIARALKTSLKTSKILILEKESKVGQHQSTLNSGVLHAGIYYNEGSYKAKFSVRGNKLMTQYCLENKLPLLPCGKLIVAKNEKEIARLLDFYDRGRKNGAPLELIEETRARQIEPHLAKTLKYPMIWSPSTSSIDNKAIVNQLESDVRNQNVEILTNQAFKKIVALSDDNVTIETNKGKIISTPKLINCAGLYSDTIAKQFGEAKDYALLPLKGIFLVDKLPYKELDLRSLIYPIPQMTSCYSYLGLHTTILPDGSAKLGPTGIPGFWKEHYYGLERINFGEIAEITGTYIRALLSPQGKEYLLQMMRQFKNYNLKQIVKEGRLLTEIYDGVEGNYKKRLTRKRPGIQAQLIDKRNYGLVEDFEFINKKSHLHIMNIASPGWTSSFAIAEHIENIIKNNK